MVKDELDDLLKNFWFGYGIHKKGYSFPIVISISYSTDLTQGYIFSIIMNLY